MRQHISQKAIELRIQWLNEALGTALEPYEGTAPNCKPTDAFYVDHSYGGYRIEQQGHSPFGAQRLTKAQLVDQLEAILAAINLARGEKHGGAWPQPAKKTERVETRLRNALTVAQATIERLHRHAPGSAQGTLDVIQAALC